MKNLSYLLILTSISCANVTLPLDRQPLESKRLIVRPVVTADTAELAEIALNPNVRRLTGLFPKLETETEVQNFVTECLVGSENPPISPRYPRAWSVIEKESGKIAGLIVFVAYSDRHRKAEIGYAFNPNYWSHGYATEACQTIVQAAFNAGLVRVYATVDPENIASERVLQKSAMTQEGLLRSYMIINGKRVDRKIYAVIAPEEPLCLPNSPK